MNETQWIEPIVLGIAAHAQKEGAQKVLKVRLRVGDLTGLKEKSFRTAFTDLTEGTPLQDAELELNFFPGGQVEVASFDIE